MNTEDFVTYEQAVKLKEIGFDWECLYYYQHKELCANTQEFAYEEEVSINTNDLLVSHNIDYPNSIYSAPTLSQAAKWLREVKGVYVVVEPRFSRYKLIGYDWLVYDDCSGDYALRAPLPFSRTYESALSAAIDAALEIIKEK